MKKGIMWLVCYFFSFIAYAFSVQPMVGTLSPSGAQSQMRFQISNTSSAPLPVEATPFLLGFDKSGQETLTDTDDIFVLPVTATIAPNSVQTFIVRYISSPRMPTSKSYRVAFEATSLAPETNISGVQLQYRFLTLINVSQPNMIAEVRQNRTFQRNGKWYLELTNNGNGFARFSEMKWRVGTGANLKAVTSEQVQEHVVGGLLLPKKTQIFEFKPFSGVSPSAMRVSITN